jgi:very-short-patch-repair endonuclease
MNDALLRLAKMAATYHGIASHDQATECGISDAAWQRLKRRGVLVPVGTHTVRHAGTPLTWYGELASGLLDLGDEAFVAARSAAALHGLDGFAPGPLELYVPRRLRGRTTSGQVHSGPAVEQIDRDEVDGLRVTSATLTILHLARDCRRDELTNALDSAVRLGLTSPDFLRRRFEAVRHRGFAGAALLDDVLIDAGVQSWLERKFLQLIRRAGLPMPAVQRIHRRGTEHIARVDFDFEPRPAIVEVGGRKGYLTRRERQRQERRRSALQAEGKVIWFFTYEDVVDDPDYVVRTLRTAVRSAA